MPRFSAYRPPINGGGGLDRRPGAGIASIAGATLADPPGARQPAVTFGMLVTRRIKPSLAMLYIVAQLSSVVEPSPGHARSSGRSGRAAMLGIRSRRATTTVLRRKFPTSCRDVVFGAQVRADGKTINIGGSPSA
jgi:hypothetical protein